MAKNWQGNGKALAVQWISSHSGLRGNEIADTEVKKNTRILTSTNQGQITVSTPCTLMGILEGFVQSSSVVCKADLDPAGPEYWWPRIYLAHKFFVDQLDH